MIIDFGSSAVDADEEEGGETIMRVEGLLNRAEGGRMSEGIFLVKYNKLPVGVVFMRNIRSDSPCVHDICSRICQLTGPTPAIVRGCPCNFWTFSWGLLPAVNRNTFLISVNTTKAEVQPAKQPYSA